MLHRFASLALKSRINARIRLFPRVSLHRFPSLGLKSRINAQIRLFPRKTLHRFPSLALKSRIDAAVWLFLRVFLQRLPSLTPEIRNHCSRGVVAFCRRNHSSLRQRRLESATEERCSHGRCRRNRSSLRQQKTESETDLVAATAAAGETILLCGNKKNRIGRRESLQSQG